MKSTEPQTNNSAPSAPATTSATAQASAPSATSTASGASAAFTGPFVYLGPNSSGKLTGDEEHSLTTGQVFKTLDPKRATVARLIGMKLLKPKK